MSDDILIYGVECGFCHDRFEDSTKDRRGNFDAFQEQSLWRPIEKFSCLQDIV